LGQPFTVQRDREPNSSGNLAGSVSDTSGSDPDTVAHAIR
jgi:hypothetical protein